MTQATQKHLASLSEKTYWIGSEIAKLAPHSSLEETKERYEKFNALLSPIHHKLAIDEFEDDEVELLLADLNEFYDLLYVLSLSLSLAPTEKAEPQEVATKEMKHEETMKTSDGPNEFGKKISEVGLCIARLAAHSLPYTTRTRHEKLIELIKQNDLNKLNLFIHELNVEMMKVAIKNGYVVIPSAAPKTPAEDKRDNVCTPSVVGRNSIFPPVTVVAESETRPMPPTGMTYGLAGT